MGKAFWDFVDLTVGDATSGNDQPTLPEGGRLTHVTLGSKTGTPPVLASATFREGNRFHTLTGGWVRGHGDPARAGDLIWDGDIKIPRNGTLDISVRNDSGSTVTIALSWAGTL